MRIAFYTLGCKLNQSESEALASGFGSRGFSVIDAREKADIYIVSTCTVTSKAEQKARRIIRKFSRSNPEAMIIITGCYVQLDRDLLNNIAPNTFLVSQDEKDILLALPEYLSSHKSGSGNLNGLSAALTAFFRQMGEEVNIHDPFSFSTDSYEYHSRAFLKIQDGCDNHCAYCRVTLARGESRSLPLKEILRRAVLLEKKGYREIVLTGVNMTSWKEPVNEDNALEKRRDFPAMLNKVLETAVNCRIRLSSLEPEMITRDLAEILSHPGICPHFHISVQSGSDPVLGRMKRKNNRKKIVQSVQLLREACGNPFLAADIIVGFPGETEEEFMESFRLIEELRFSELHVFPYSPRPGTAALTLKNPVPERITGERTSILRELSMKLHESYLKSCERRTFGFLLEQKVEDEDSSMYQGPETLSDRNRGEIWIGTSENYLKMHVFISNEVIENNSPVPEKGAIILAQVRKDSSGKYTAFAVKI